MCSRTRTTDPGSDQAGASADRAIASSAQPSQNRAAGLPPVCFQQHYQSAGDYYLALRSGRIDLYVGPNPSVAYHVATAGETKKVGQIGGGGQVDADIAAMTKKGNGLVGRSPMR